MAQPPDLSCADARNPIPLPSRIRASPDRVAQYCERWHVTSFWPFGSVLRDDFGPASHIDVHVEFHRDQIPGLAFVRTGDELSEILGRPVDLLNWTEVKYGPNRLRRDEVPGSARLVYEDGLFASA